MKAKGILSLFLALGAGYYLYKNNNTKNSSNNNTTANTSTNNPQVKYTGTNNPNTVNNPTVQNVPGIDGVPFKDSPLYFGDKTKPYDSFYDFSDGLGRLYYGYVAPGLIIQDENHFNGIRFRILDPGITFKETLDGARKLVANEYNVSVRMEVFNPFGKTLNVSSITPTEIKYCFRDMITFPALKTYVNYVQILSPPPDRDTLIKQSYKNDTYPDFREENISFTLRPGSNQVFFKLNHLVDKETTGMHKFIVNNENAMFLMRFRMNLGNGVMYYNYKAALYYGSKPTILSESFWENSYTQDFSLFVPLEQTSNTNLQNYNFNALNEIDLDAMNRAITEFLNKQNA